LITVGLLVAAAVASAPNAFPNGTKGSNINATPALPTNFKKSKRDTKCTFGISYDNRFLKHIKCIGST
jgi:hypothetical protein